MPLSRLKYLLMYSSGIGRLDELRRRRQFTAERFIQLQNELVEAREICGEKACVYATGSYGRHEASLDSDLDLFIVGMPVFSKDVANIDGDRRELNRLNEICLKAELIKATKTLKLPEFDGDGEYLKHYTGKELVSLLGKPDDDMRNTFTARLLLLLESKPLLGDGVYKSVIQGVVDAYWRDYEGHENEFVPTYFVNDVLRLWRTFCVNYEARTKTEPDQNRFKRRVKNYKLKHSRMLTCFSAILNLLAKYRQNRTVTVIDLCEIVYSTPTERLEWILNCDELNDSHDKVQSLLDTYNAFLSKSSVGTTSLLELFSNTEDHKTYMAEAAAFGDKMYESLKAVGGDSPLLRQLMV